MCKQDENDNAPAFSASLYSYSVVENNNPRTIVGDFEVNDSDLSAAGRVSAMLIGAYSDR